MYIYKDLFTDNEMRDKYRSVIRKIRMNAGMMDIYLICLAGANDNFDIIDAMQLKQKGYPKNELMLMGIAKGKENAISLATDMYVYFYKKYQNINFKSEIVKEKETLFRRK